jgi:hypothetical protein
VDTACDAGFDHLRAAIEGVEIIVYLRLRESGHTKFQAVV